MKTKSIARFVLLLCSFLFFASGCSNSKTDENSKENEDEEIAYEAGSNYEVFKRIRILDKEGFEKPVEAYSMLLPDGWKHKSNIEWKGPGTGCDGTNSSLKAFSENKDFSLEMFPGITYNSTQGYSEMEQLFGRNSCAEDLEAMDAEQYLRDVFAKELDNADVIKVTENEAVVKQMRQKNNAFVNEMQQYGAGQISFKQTAINARVRWDDGTEGLVILGVNTTEAEVANNYNGSSSGISTTAVYPKIVFKYPKGERESAETQFAVIMSSIRTNTAWKNAVDGYWKQISKKKDVVHRDQIEMNDELTASMGRETIRRGKERLAQMDVDLRNWEMNQSSQDRIHTNFVNAIREVENYQDETGKYEMTSAYDHAFSRGDGRTFVMSNDPNFDPQFVFQDQSWKEMKRVD